MLQYRASTNVESPPEEVSAYLAARRNRYPSHDRVANPTEQEEKIHIPTINQSCRFYWKGTCKKMSECPYMHIASHSKVQPQQHNAAAAAASGATANNHELQQSSAIPEVCDFWFHRLLLNLNIFPCMSRRILQEFCR